MKVYELLEWGRIVKGVNTTVDVGPNEIKIQAAKFGNSVDKDGHPPTLSKRVKGKSTNVLYNLGLAEEKDHIPYQDLVAQAINDKKMTFINPNTGKEQSVMNPKHVGNRQKELEFKYTYDYPMTSQERAELRPWVNIPGDKNLMKMPVTQMTVDQAVKWDMLGHPDMPQATINAARERYPDDEKVKNPTTYKLKSEGLGLTESKKTLVLEKLPYSKDGLNPVMSKDTIDYHYGKLAAGYVKRYNAKEGNAKFNEAGAFLHNIFFPQMTEPKGSNKPNGASEELINKKYKSFDKFKEKFEKVAMGIQGSGWVYMSTTGEIKTIVNHEVKNDIALLVDWWEHAWALDYQSDKGKYLNNIWRIINWDVVNERLK